MAQLSLYHDILLFLHFVGLAMGLGIGVANLFITRWAGESDNPDHATLLRSLPPRLGQLSTIGLGILVVTGLLLLFTVGGTASYAFGQFWFYIKLLGAGAMIAIAYFLYDAQRAMRAGQTPQFAQYLPMSGPAMGGLALLVVLVSAFVFH